MWEAVYWLGDYVGMAVLSDVAFDDAFGIDKTVAVAAVVVVVVVVVVGEVMMMLMMMLTWGWEHHRGGDHLY